MARKVKWVKTLKKFLIRNRDKTYTIFRITEYGYTYKDNVAVLSKVLVSDSYYEIWNGSYTEYPEKLPINRKAEIYKPDLDSTFLKMAIDFLEACPFATPTYMALKTKVPHSFIVDHRAEIFTGRNVKL